MNRLYKPFLTAVYLLLFAAFTSTSFGQPPTPVQTWPVGNTTTYSTSQLLTWYPSPWAANLTYTVQVFIGDTTGTKIYDQTDTFTSLNATVTGLVGSTLYTWRVRSINNSGTSAWATTTFTTTSSLPPPNTYTIVASSGANGTVTPADTSTVNEGLSQTYTITPSSGYNISSITVDGSPVTVTSSSGQTYTFSNVTANHTISATFIANYIVTATSDANGTITPSGAVGVDAAGDKTFTFTPNAGYTFESLTVDAVLTNDSTTSYTFSNVTATHTIAVTFKTIKDTITVTAGTGGSITPNGPVIVNYGSDQAFTITPDDFYVIDSVFVDDNWVDSTSSYTFINVTANHTIRAVFAADSNLYVETTGDDVTGNGSLATPYKTIQKALDDVVTNSRAGWTINIGTGTFTEDLDFDGDLTTTPPTTQYPITKAPANVEIKGNGKDLTIIKGISLASYPNLSANFMISANGLKVHDLTFKGPDVHSTETSTSIVFTGTNMEFYNINFIAVITDDESALAQDDGYTIIMQSWNHWNGLNQTIPKVPASDISGLNIHDNTFTSIESATPGGNYAGASYEAIYLNPSVNNTSFTINNNTFGGNLYRAIATQVSNLTISNNAITSNIAPTNRGIWIVEGSTVSITGNNITNFATGIKFGYSVPNPDWAENGIGLSVTATNNFISNNTVGIKVIADFSSYTATTTGVLTITDNTIKSNTTSGLDASDSKGGLSTSGFVYLDATNNWWGDTDGPEDATFLTTSNELPAGSATDIETWINGDPAGSLGNKVVDNNAAFAAGGFFVKYYPWDGGTPSITLEDITTVSTATFNMDVDLTPKSNSFNTLQGTFNYDATKLTFVSASYGTGTLINSAGWLIFFNEPSSGTVNFAGVGATAINSPGNLFSLNFSITGTTDDTTYVAADSASFLADGNAIFTTNDSGQVIYTFQNAVYTRGDVNLDGSVTIDDALLLQQNITNGTVASLSALAIQNADADLSGGGTTANSTHISLNDVLAILQYVSTGSWPTSMASPAANVTFSAPSIGQNGLVNLPVQIQNAADVKTLEIQFNYDSQVVDYQTFKQYMLASGNFVNANKVRDGVARFTYATPNNLSGNVEPGKLVLKLLNGIPNSSDITTSYSLNGGDFKEGPKYTIGKVTSVDNEPVIPTKFEVEQNYPNPFNPTTTIRFALPQATFVTLKIYNMLGQLVKTLINEQKNAGTFNVRWRGDNSSGLKVSSGTYIYRVIAGPNIVTKKMILLK